MAKVTEKGNDLLVFEVESSTPGHEPYTVDLLANNGLGHCSCTSWGVRNWKHVKLGEKSLCKHISMSREYFLDQLLSRLSKTKQ